MLQIYTNGFALHFRDPWNWLDFLKIILVFYFVAAGWNDSGSEYETILVALMILLRGLSIFRIFDGTRYYVKLIFVSLSSFKYFLIIFFYSTFCFAIFYTISQKQKLDFSNIWSDSWSLNFGDMPELGENANFPLNYICLLCGVIINVVLMLNMLISILGDSYDQFQIDKNIIDYREKLQNSLEYRRIFTFHRKIQGLQFLHVLTSPFAEDENLDWSGKIIFLDKRIIKLQNSIDENNQGVHQDVKRFEEKVQRRIQDLEGKINGVQINTSEIERRVAGVEDILGKIFKIISK
jgi:hypothetical protein